MKEYKAPYNGWVPEHTSGEYVIVYPNGIKWWLWFKGFVTHRSDGPAIEDADGYKEWWLNGKRHRVDGPAIERYDGSKYYFYKDKSLEN